MTKEQCTAIINAIAKTAEYLAEVRVRNKKPNGATGEAVLEDLNDAFEGYITDIIADIPDDPEVVDNGGGNDGGNNGGGGEG